MRSKDAQKQLARTSLNSGLRLLLELRCTVLLSRHACCLLYYLWEINSGIHIYQFTFELSTLLFPDVVVVSDLNRKDINLADRRIS